MATDAMCVWLHLRAVRVLEVLAGHAGCVLGAGGVDADAPALLGIVGSSATGCVI